MNLKLSQKKCLPCNGKTPKLNSKDISNNLSKINYWSINNEQEMIFKKFKFKSYKRALQFANSVSDIAEKEQHHPDITFGWGYCVVMIHTHAIKGLSQNDFILASKIDKIISLDN